MRHPCVLAKSDGECVKMAGMSACGPGTVPSGGVGEYGAGASQGVPSVCLWQADGKVQLFLN